MRKLLRVVGICFAVTVSSSAVSDNGFAKEICNSLPKPLPKFQGMRLKNSEKYKDDKLGVSARYVGKSEVLTFFKFDFGRKTIDDEILNKLFSKAIQELYQFADKVGEKLDNPKEIGIIPFAGFSMRHFHVLGYTETLIASEMLSMGHDGICITKIRYTNTKSTNLLGTLEQYQVHLDILEKYISEK